jgi:hypothetical protein
MPVENLAIVEGPMSGLGTNGTAIQEGEMIERTRKWLVEHDIRPWWLIGGAAVGLFAGETKLKGAAIGAALGSGFSWLCSRTCRAESPVMVGVESVAIGQIEPSGIQGLGQIEPSGIQGLGAIEMTRANIIGLAAAGLVGTYLIFGRG